MINQLHYIEHEFDTSEEFGYDIKINDVKYVILYFPIENQAYLFEQFGNLCIAAQNEYPDRDIDVYVVVDKKQNLAGIMSIDVEKQVVMNEGLDL